MIAYTWSLFYGHINRILNMAKKTPLTKLIIVGFNDRLCDGLYPAIVAPVFQFKDDKSKLLIPPFKIEKNMVNGGDILTGDEWAEQLDRENMTSITPIEPKVDHSLWVDTDKTIKYDSYSECSKTLLEMSLKHLSTAKTLAGIGKLDEAEESLAISFNANNNCIGALAFECAIDIRKGEKDYSDFFVRTMTHISITEEEFSVLIKHYDSFINTSRAAKRNRNPQLFIDELNREGFKGSYILEAFLDGWWDEKIRKMVVGYGDLNYLDLALKIWYANDHDRSFAFEVGCTWANDDLSFDGWDGDTIRLLAKRIEEIMQKKTDVEEFISQNDQK